MVRELRHGTDSCRVDVVFTTVMAARFTTRVERLTEELLEEPTSVRREMRKVEKIVQERGERWDDEEGLTRVRGGQGQNEEAQVRGSKHEAEKEGVTAGNWPSLKPQLLPWRG